MNSPFRNQKINRKGIAIEENGKYQTASGFACIRLLDHIIKKNSLENFENKHRFRLIFHPFSQSIKLLLSFYDWHLLSDETQSLLRACAIDIDLYSYVMSMS